MLGTFVRTSFCLDLFTYVVDDISLYSDGEIDQLISCVYVGCFELDCPTTVTVTESTGPYNAGDMLRCSSDGYPEPSYSWTDADGNVVSTASTVTLFGGPFDYQCTVTGNFTTPCSASSARVSGNAAGKKRSQIRF